MTENISPKYNLAFWLHLLVLVIGWIGPFLIDWRMLCVGYLAVQVQFIFFKRCLMNKEHALADDDDATFYSFLLEEMGFNVPRRPIKLVVRNGLYVFLALVAFGWQVLLKQDVPFRLPF
jgi:hypothetical protein